MLRAIDYPLMIRPVRRDPSEVPVTVVTSPAKIAELADAVRTADAVAVDTETHDELTLHNGMWAMIRVISVATRHGDTYAKYVIDRLFVDDKLIADAMSQVRLAYAWNANFDDLVMRINGFPIKLWWDVMLDESVYWTGIDGRGWYLSLAVAAHRYLGYEMSGKGSVQTSFDGTTPLTDEQITYAADDALLTLWIGELLSEKIVEHGLTRASELEQKARPFIAQMTEVGFPFALEDWRENLSKHETKRDGALRRIAELCSESGEKPSFNVDSDVQLKQKLNIHAPEYVKRRFGRLMEPHDQVDKASLKELAALGCELAERVLEYRSAQKFVTTYGDNIVKYVADGRVRSRYKQCLTATGRLASDYPNAQNWPGETKYYIRSVNGRVQVVADYSQAELRVLAADSEEEVMLSAFRSGKDLHDETAKDIFGTDLNELKKTDPKAAKDGRTKTKRVNFGIPYKMGAFALARGLTNEGVETTPDEAQEMIDKIMGARPKMAAYLKARDAFVDGFADEPGPIDWDASFRLLSAWQRFESPRRAFKREHKRLPSARELAEAVDYAENSQPSLFDVIPTDEEREAAIAADAALIDWAFTYDAPVVLRPAVVDADGTRWHEPVGFESRTVSGRRRIFTVVMDSGYKRSETEMAPGVGGGRSSKASDKFDGVVTAAMLLAATTDHPERARVRDEWAAANGFAGSLPSGVNRCGQRDGESPKEFRARAREFANAERTKCVKAFEGGNKRFKTEFVQHVLSHVGEHGAQLLLRKSLKDCIKKLGPAARNHPIQGGVADIAEHAFAGLWELREQYPDLVWIQSVHDSIVGECDEENGKAVAIAQRRIMEDAMTEFFPTVPAKVDAEVARHQGDTGIIYEVTDDDVAAARQAIAAERLAA